MQTSNTIPHHRVPDGTRRLVAIEWLGIVAWLASSVWVLAALLLDGQTSNGWGVVRGNVGIIVFPWVYLIMIVPHSWYELTRRQLIWRKSMERWYAYAELIWLRGGIATALPAAWWILYLEPELNANLAVEYLPFIAGTWAVMYSTLVPFISPFWSK